MLTSLGISFTQASPTAEESTARFDNVIDVAADNAEIKAQSVLAGQREATVVIGADTLVALEGRVLGKPKDREEAKSHLHLLSGKKHQVHTGLCLLSKKDGIRKITVTSEISFHSLSQETIENYARTREPLDKAGAYASQGLGSRFIKEVKGSYWNVVGFPLETFLDELEKLTGVSAFEYFM